MSFHEYMELCLYHPEVGYYTRGAGIGREGDFYTSPHLHPIFGWTLARWALPLLQSALKRQPRVRILELGPGEGYLAKDVLDFLQREDPQVYQRVEYLLYERSPEMVRRQRALLEGHPVAWVEQFSEASGAVLVWSNEFYDAFPCYRFLRTSQGWRELRVVLEPQDRLAFQPFPVEDPDHRSFLARYTPLAEPGTVLEIAPSIEHVHQALLAQVRPQWVVTIDYGERRPLLLRRFPQGSLAIYYRHRYLEDPFQYPGESDITWHIDFTLLEEAGEATGYRTRWFGDQGRFLLQAGILEVLQNIERQEPDERQRIRARLAVKTLVYSFGKEHRVLVQEPGFEHKEVNADGDSPRALGGATG